MENKRLVMCTSSGCLQFLKDEEYVSDIDIIPVHLYFKDKEYLEGSEDCITPESIYEQMKKTSDLRENLPHTGMPTFEEVSSHFQKAIDNGYDEVIVISISSGLGGTWNFISLVANNYRDKLKINVIDSRCVAYNEGYLAILANKRIKEGKTTAEILDEIEWVKTNMRFIGYTSRLDYLIFNGRLKGAKAYMGKMMKVCPVLYFNDKGEIVPISNKMGAKNAAMGTCTELLKVIGGRTSEDYILLHGYTGKTSCDLLKQVEKKFSIVTNHYDVVLSPVSGIHTGPWLCGYTYIPLRRDIDK